MGTVARTAARIAACLVFALAVAAPAPAAPLRSGIAAFNRHNYNAAAVIFGPLAEIGNARAQSYLGFMYETGRGVPQDYLTAAYWYRRAANQGEVNAQCRLGLLFDKGLGVTQDYIVAHKWLNLAAAHAPPATREYYTHLRDALAAKMTRGEIGTARVLALQWVAVRERPVVIAHP
jgi:TPR repeat protein